MTTLFCTQCATSIEAPCNCTKPRYEIRSVMLQMRKEIALKLHKDGMTQQAIATRLGISQMQVSRDLNVALNTMFKGNKPMAEQPRKTDILGRPASPGRPRNATPRENQKSNGKERPTASKTTAIMARQPSLQKRIERLEKTYKAIRKVRERGAISYKLYRSIKAVLHHPENVSEAKLHELRVEWDTYGWLLAEKYQSTPTLTDVDIHVKEKANDE